MCLFSTSIISAVSFFHTVLTFWRFSFQLRHLQGRINGRPNQPPFSNNNMSQNGHNNDSDKERSQDDGPPASVGFWDLSLSHVRKRAFQKWIVTTAILMVFILCVLSL